MTYQATEKTLPGGTVVDVPLVGNPDFAETQVAFSGRSSGVVTVTARAFGSSKFEPVQDGAVDLATTGSIRIPGFALAEIRLSDAGSGSFKVTAIQRT